MLQQRTDVKLNNSKKKNNKPRCPQPGDRLTPLKAPARLFCSAAPIAPPTAPVLSHTARPSAGESRLSVQGSFDVTVELSLAGQAPGLERRK